MVADHAVNDSPGWLRLAFLIPCYETRMSPDKVAAKRVRVDPQPHYPSIKYLRGQSATAFAFLWCLVSERGPCDIDTEGVDVP